MCTMLLSIKDHKRYGGVDLQTIVDSTNDQQYTTHTKISGKIIIPQTTIITISSLKILCIPFSEIPCICEIPVC